MSVFYPSLTYRSSPSVWFYPLDHELFILKLSCLRIKVRQRHVAIFASAPAYTSIFSPAFTHPRKPPGKCARTSSRPAL